jgi:hypothetical protein
MQWGADARIPLGFVRRKSGIRVSEGPHSGPPLGIGWDGEGYFASIKSGLFCVYESRLSHRSPIFFLQTDRQ